VTGSRHGLGDDLRNRVSPIPGGILRYADAWGIRTSMSILSKLEKEHGVRFKPASLLKEMAESGRSFYAT